MSESNTLLSFLPQAITNYVETTSNILKENFKMVAIFIWNSRQQNMNSSINYTSFF